eukprot:3590632-Prymnesium_polylepis.2
MTTRLRHGGPPSCWHSAGGTEHTHRALSQSTGWPVPHTKMPAQPCDTQVVRLSWQPYLPPATLERLEVQFEAWLCVLMSLTLQPLGIRMRPSTMSCVVRCAAAAREKAAVPHTAGLLMIKNPSGMGYGGKLRPKLMPPDCRWCITPHGGE